MTLTKKEALPLVQRACAIAHGKGAGMSLLQLWELVLEDGLPTRVERDVILAERLRDDGADGTGDTSDDEDTPNASA